jgi:Leucine-rich repeat (LRR) protein
MLNDLYLSGNRLGSLPISLITEKTFSYGKLTILDEITLTMNDLLSADF